MTVHTYDAPAITPIEAQAMQLALAENGFPPGNSYGLIESYRRILLERQNELAESTAFFVPLTDEEEGKIAAQLRGPANLETRSTNFDPDR
jgi:hypothetical protein